MEDKVPDFDYNFGEILYFIIHPLFECQAKFLFREIYRLTDYQNFYYMPSVSILFLYFFITFLFFYKWDYGLCSLLFCEREEFEKFKGREKLNENNEIGKSDEMNEIQEVNKSDEIDEIDERKWRSWSEEVTKRKKSEGLN